MNDVIKVKDLFAFWEYSLFPYFIGAPITKMNKEGLVYAPNYLGWVKPLSILPLKSGRAIKEKLNALEKEYKSAEEELRNEYVKKRNAFASALLNPIARYNENKR